MRKFNLLLIFTILTFISCSDNENEINSSESYFELNGVRYELKSGYFVNDNPDEFIIQLIDGTMTSGVLDTENISDDTTVAFSTYIHSSELVGDFTLSEIESGTVGASAECSKISSNQFECNKTFNLSNNSNESGAISIVKNSNIYEIKFEFTNANNENIKGIYTGVLNELTI
jgi:hypothetical protein